MSSAVDIKTTFQALGMQNPLVRSTYKPSLDLSGSSMIVQDAPISAPYMGVRLCLASLGIRPVETHHETSAELGIS